MAYPWWVHPRSEPHPIKHAGADIERGNIYRSVSQAVHIDDSSESGKVARLVPQYPQTGYSPYIHLVHRQAFGTLLKLQTRTLESREGRNHGAMQHPPAPKHPIVGIAHTDIQTPVIYLMGVFGSSQTVGQFIGERIGIQFKLLRVQGKSHNDTAATPLLAIALRKHSRIRETTVVQHSIPIRLQAPGTKAGNPQMPLLILFGTDRIAVGSTVEVVASQHRPVQAGSKLRIAGTLAPEKPLHITLEPDSQVPVTEVGSYLADRSGIEHILPPLPVLLPVETEDADRNAYPRLDAEPVVVAHRIERVRLGDGQLVEKEFQPCRKLALPCCLLSTCHCTG